MAVSANSWFSSGKNQGVPSVSADFDKFAEHATPRFAVGFKVEDGDGNVYRYSHFGATVNRGVLVAQDVSESSLGDSNDVIVASASCSIVTDGTVGYKHLEITAGDHGAGEIKADHYAGGKFIVSDDAGEGYTYDIVGNTANAVLGSNFRLQLKQKLQVAVTATSDFIIVGNKYANLEIATNGTDCFVAGVSCRSISTAAYYGWVQTVGIVGILSDSNTEVIGEKIVLSTVTNGAVVCASAGGAEASQTIDQLIGTCVVAGDADGHGAYYINLE